MNDTFRKWGKDVKIILRGQNTTAKAPMEVCYNSQIIKCISQRVIVFE